MVAKKSLFSFYFCSKFNISLIILPISFLSIRFLHDKMFCYERPRGSFKIFKYNFPYLFYLYLPKLFSIILFIITKWKIKSEGTPDQTNLVTKNYHIIKINEYKKMILYLCLVSLLEVLYDIIDSLIYYYIMNGRFGWLVEKKTCTIIFVPLFSYFILDKVLYNHHALGLFLGFIGGFFVNACRFFLGFSKMENRYFHLLNIFLSSLYSLALVLIKYIMKKYIFLSPYLFYLYLPKLFSIILFFITKWKIKREGALDQTNILTKNYHIIKINEYGTKIILYLCIVSLLEVLYDNIDSLIYYYIMKGKIMWLIEKKTVHFFLYHYFHILY